MPSMGESCPRCGVEVYSTKIDFDYGELQTLYYPDPDTIVLTLSCDCVFRRHNADFDTALAVVWRSWKLPPMPPPA